MPGEPNAVSNAIEYAKFRSRSPVHRKSRAKLAADKDVVVHVPDRRLLRAKVEEHKVRVPVAVEIAHRYHEPARRKSRAKGAADKDVVVHVPDPRLLKTSPPLEHKVWVSVAVEIAHPLQVRYGHARTKQNQRQCRAGEENQSESSGQIKSSLCKVHFHFLVAP